LRLEPLYRIRFTYPESWMVSLDGGWEQHLFLAGAVFHSSEADQYRRLNDAVCVCVGEVRAPADPAQPEPDLVLDVAELIWEPIAD
jgi:hypothetical protein